MDEMRLRFHVCLGEREVVIGVYAGSYYPLAAGQAAFSTPPSPHCLLRGVLESLREFIEKFERLPAKLNQQVRAAAAHLNPKKGV